jgi:hypothetical protein
MVRVVSDVTRGIRVGDGVVFCFGEIPKYSFPYVGAVGSAV